LILKNKSHRRFASLSFEQLKFSSFGGQPLAEVPDTRAITGTRTFEK
jgi:hypothetical protein